MLEAQFLDGVILDRVILEKSKDKKKNLHLLNTEKLSGAKGYVLLQIEDHLKFRKHSL